MKIVFFEIQGWEKELLKIQLRGHKLTFISEPLSESTVSLAAAADVVSVFIYSKVNKTVLKKLKKTKLIVTRSTGFDHIDVAAAKKNKIFVCNVPFYGENTVAEHTFALILALSRNVHKSYVRTLRDDFSIDGLQGFDLKGKTMGVIGAGHIGLHVIKIARGFGMNVLAYDPNENTFLAEVLDFKYAPLKKVLGQSDIISIHVPYNKKTHHLINKKNIDWFKKGAILINTARGGLIETDALLKALDDGRLAGAGLDVLEGENLIKEEKQLLYDKHHSKALKSYVQDHILLDKENVVFTPHIAFYSQEALNRILTTTIDNIKAFIDSDPQNTI